jgi:hypothetical protein
MFCGICGNELPDEFRFCPKCGQAIAACAAVDVGDATTAAARDQRSLQPSSGLSSKEASGPKHDGAYNVGTILLATFSGLSVFASLFKGIVYLAEAALWGGLAWYWHKNNPRSPVARGAVILLAVAVIAGECFLIGRQPTGNVQPFQPRNYPKTQLGPEWKRTLQRSKLAVIGPAELLEHCGSPALDATGTVETQRFGVLPHRKIVYRAVGGSTLDFSFVSLDDGVSWIPPKITDGNGRVYDNSDDTDLDRIWVALPCLPY